VKAAFRGKAPNSNFILAGCKYSPHPVLAGCKYSPHPVLAGCKYSPHPILAGRKYSPHPCPDVICPYRSGRTTRQTVRRNFSSIGKQGNLRVNKHFDFSDDSVSAAKFPSASGRVAQRIAMHTNGIDMFEHFDWSIERIRHVAVRGASSVAAGSRARTACDRFVICKWSAATPRVRATKCQVVHGALARGWYSRRDRTRKRPKQRIHNALRGFHVPSGHRRR
jgi:hypothetical protein